MIKRISLIIISVLLLCNAYAQIPVGTWRAHLSYVHTTKVAQTPNKIFAIADKHLYSINIADKQIDTYSKIDGFSENTVHDVAYSAEKKMLVLVYDNSNIDLVTENGDIYNIPDLYNKNIVVDKTVYQIHCEGNYAYLATGFSIVVIDLKKKEILDTYIIGDNGVNDAVYGFCSDDTYFYALTSTKIKRALKNGVNLLDYTNWQTDAIELPSEYTTMRTLFNTNNGGFIYSADNRVHKYLDGAFTIVYESSHFSSLSKSSEIFLISAGKRGVHLYDIDMNYIKHLDNEDALYTIYDSSKDSYYIAENFGGCSFVDANLESEKFLPRSINTLDVQKLRYDSKNLYVAPGGNWTDRFTLPANYSVFTNDIWTTYTGAFIGFLDYTDYAFDIVDVIPHPANSNHLFVATWGEGIFEIVDNKAIALYNDVTTNGIIESAIPGNSHFNRVDGFAYDKDANLWFLNSSASKALKVYTADGQWKEFAINGVANLSNLRNLSISKKHGAFGVSVRSQPRFFVSELPDLETGLLGNSRAFTSITDKDGHVLSPAYFYDAIEDKDGTIWIATDLGPVLAKTVSKIYDSNYTFTRVKIPRNDGSGLADYLLEGVGVVDIDVDGGNRKWLATLNSGVYLISADGISELLHFTSKNSPLSSDQISQVCVNQKTGEVFIATATEIFSYRSDATEPVKEVDPSKVYAFPNPVRPEFDGVVTIMGLEEESHVRITDAGANVVFEGMSNGGSISWNLRNASGNKVAGGMYFVLASNSSTEENRSVSTKFLVVR